MQSCILWITVANGENCHTNFQRGKRFIVFSIALGLWDNILQHLVEVTRKRAGRNPNPTYAIIDSQSVDTAYASEHVGYDGGKKNKGHKRHILTDTLGNLLAVKVHRANLHDTKAGIFPAIKAFVSNNSSNLCRCWLS